MLRTLETLTDHDIRSARTISVFVEEEETTSDLLRPPSSADGTEGEEAMTKPDLCIAVKTQADRKTLEDRVKQVLGEFIE